MEEEPTPRPARFVRPPPPPLARDCALFLDIDGTLAELANVPDAVRIDDELAVALPKLSRELGGALALVTGRSITSADRLFPNVKLPMAGQHGAERRDAKGTIYLHAPRKDTYARLGKLLKGLAKRHPRLLLEDKGAAIALHYRALPELAGELQETLEAELRAAEGYTLQPGKMLLEVRPEGRTKGTAIDDFMAEAPFAGRLPVFLGDDLTDEHGFATVERLGGWTVKVGPGRTEARFRLADVAAVGRWLLAPVQAAPFPALENSSAS
ncbi:MAG: trehalose-phosphatase [Burkholderiales bacterium]|nr:trehalose-phosphatase [Burkholderiales bacterium]